MNTVTFHVPADVPAPRGAAWAAQAAAAVSRVIARRTAPRAQAKTPSVEAARVRELARSYLNSEPAFAADLLAAADRHEAANAGR